MEGTYSLENTFTINYEQGDKSLQRVRIKHNEDVKDRTHVVIQGETLPMIAFREYGHSKYWSLIADVNVDIINPFLLTPGQSLMIPNKDIYE